MARGRKHRPDHVAFSYGRGQAKEDGLVAPAEVLSAPDFVPLFESGEVAVTPGAVEALETAGLTVADLVNRHIVGDWGEIDEEDRKLRLNEQALESGARIFSRYEVDGASLYVITDAATAACTFCHGSAWGEAEHRLTTTVLTPSEY